MSADVPLVLCNHFLGVKRSNFHINKLSLFCQKTAQISFTKAKRKEGWRMDNHGIGKSLTHVTSATFQPPRKDDLKRHTMMKHIIGETPYKCNQWEFVAYLGPWTWMLTHFGAPLWNKMFSRAANGALDYNSGVHTGTGSELYHCSSCTCHCTSHFSRAALLKCAIAIEHLQWNTHSSEVWDGSGTLQL